MTASLHSAPFSDIIVGNPWASDTPDLPEINQRCFEQLIRLIAQVNPQTSLSAMVFGGTGSGKTHLIRRVLHSGEDFACVYVYPIKDPKRMNRKLLDSVVADLQRSRGKQETQLVELLQRILERSGMLESGADVGAFLTDPAKDAKLKALKTQLMGGEFLRSIERDFIDVLFLVCREDVRGEVVRFLSGLYLEPGECSRLGISLMEEPGSAEDGEIRAQELLVAFGKAFGKAGLPLVLCFDQLENMGEPQQQREFGTMVANIINEVPQTLPICFTRPDFADKAAKQMDEHVWQRLFANRFQIDGCDKAQARDLIRVRMEWAGSGADPSNEVRIDATLADLEAEINVPRKVLMEAGRHIGPNAKGGDPLEKIAEFYESELQRLINAPQKTACRPDVIIGGLATFLEARPQLPGGFQVRREVQTKSAGLDKGGSLETSIGTPAHRIANLTVSCDRRDYGSSLGSLFKALTGKARRAGELDLVVFLRDDRDPIEAKKNAKKDFELAGGVYLEFPYRWHAEFEALDTTRNAVEAGDWTYLGEANQVQVISQDDFQRFLRDAFHPRLANRLLAQIELNSDPDLLLEVVADILNREPFFLDFDTISQHLRQRAPHLHVTSETLLNTLRRAPDRIAEVGEHQTFSLIRDGN